MYTSIVEAAAHDLQNERLARAEHSRLAHSASHAGRRQHRRMATPHPVRGFQRWLAAGQL
ncbi:hypothetical protein [uncultured Jatrophihabitans sp.]|uniref:hypothetical protein n=1 Tax=uncultured Jatrophihabitans sp. TaxID=1610747 RepID=UPI0035CC5418